MEALSKSSKKRGSKLKIFKPITYFFLALGCFYIQWFAIQEIQNIHIRANYYVDHISDFEKIKGKLTAYGFGALSYQVDHLHLRYKPTAIGLEYIKDQKLYVANCHAFIACNASIESIQKITDSGFPLTDIQLPHPVDIYIHKEKPYWAFLKLSSKEEVQTYKYEVMLRYALLILFLIFLQFILLKPYFLYFKNSK